MNPQSTDKLPLSANQDIPSILFRKKFSVVTSTSGSGYAEIVSTVTAPGIKIGAYNEFSLIVNDSGTVYQAPIRTYTSAQADKFWANIWLDSSDMTNSDSTATYRYQVRKYGGATTDSYICWLVLWSTKISDNLNLFDTSY